MWITVKLFLNYQTQVMVLTGKETKGRNIQAMEIKLTWGLHLQSSILLVKNRKVCHLRDKQDGSVGKLFKSGGAGETK